MIVLLPAGVSPKRVVVLRSLGVALAYPREPWKFWRNIAAARAGWRPHYDGLARYCWELRLDAGQREAAERGELVFERRLRRRIVGPFWEPA